MTAKQRAIRARLSELEDESGFLDLDVVIEAAKDPKDPMHGQFTWDVEKAAKERWREQARAMIRSVRYVEKVTHVELKAPKYASVTVTPGKTGYKPLDLISAKRDEAEEVFQEEVKRALAALARARNVSDILGMRARLEVVIAGLLEIQQAAA